MALDLSTLTAQQQIAAIYIGYYDRAADPFGSSFWESALANPNLSLEDIADDFATQDETLIAYPFLADPTEEEAAAFITEVYLNLFNRLPDDEGLAFWSAALVAGINGDPDAPSVGQIILEIIEGAQGEDITTITNKIDVSTAWTDAADEAGLNEEGAYEGDAAAQASAKSIIEPVTSDPDTVDDALDTIDEFFEPAPVPGDTLSFSIGGDNLSGTANDDKFEGFLSQSGFTGGVANTLATGDRADGGEGNDSLYAQLVSTFVGATPGAENVDNQPRLTNIETIEFEAFDIAQNAPLGFDIQDLLASRLDDLGFALPEEIFEAVEDFVGVLPSEELIALLLDGWQRDITVDAKDIVGHEFLGSTFSDGDLLIENVTTLDNNGGARNTKDITIGMDHTDNANSDGDASDLTVYFDEDYLISGQTQESETLWFLLDEDAELAGLDDRLNNIDVDGLLFEIADEDGNFTGDLANFVAIQSDAANVAGTHEGFVNALQEPLQQLIADGVLPQGSQLVLDPTRTDTTFLDNGDESDLIPAIVLISGDGTPVMSTGFTRIEEPIGEYDVYGRLETPDPVTTDEPVSVNIDLFKAGRGGEGGNLVIGGKDQTEEGDGIEVFHVNVMGAGDDAVVDQPSNIGTLTSTNNALREIYISTDAEDIAKGSVANLTIRDGFNELYDGDSTIERESGDLQLVNADAFLGDLTLGSDQDIVNLDTLTAQGGGDVSFYAWLNGDEVDQYYSYSTGSGDDFFDVEIDLDAIDYAGAGVNIWSGAGNDYVFVDFDPAQTFQDRSNELLNTWILDNVLIETGDGDDIVEIHDENVAIINTGSGDDIIYTDGDPETFTDDGPGDVTAIWAFNFDAERTGDQGLATNGPDDLPGEALSLAYLEDAKITVTLSGAGVLGATDTPPAGGGIVDGGGVMAFDNDDAEGAIAGEDGYEATVTIGNLINGNDYYGDQRDINAAIVRAITEDPILSALLDVSIAADNTLVVVSKTAGDFQDTDLRVDIQQASFSDAALAEARELFGDSSITADPGADLSSSAAADAYYDGLSYKGDDANSTDAGVGEGQSNLHTAGFAPEGEMDSVINGGDDDDLIILSTDSTANSSLDDFTVSPDNATLNGASNQTVVMEGDDFGDDTVMNFLTAKPEDARALVEADETIGSITDSEEGDPGVPDRDALVLDTDITDGLAGRAVATLVTFDLVEVTVPAGATAEEVVDLFLDAFSTPSISGYYAEANEQTPDTSQVLFFNDTLDVDDVNRTEDITPSDVAFETDLLTVTGEPAVPATFVVTLTDPTLDDVDPGEVITILGEEFTVSDTATAGSLEAAITAFSFTGWTVTDDADDGVITFTGDVDPDPFTPLPDFGDSSLFEFVIAGDASIAVEDIMAGLDFLDFTAYLTSEEDVSSNPPGSDSTDSNNVIKVTLDYNETDSLGGSGDGSGDADVEANEVAVVRLDTDGAEGETFANLNASVVANLFNGNVDEDDEWGGLAESEFAVELYNKVDQEELIGDAMAIFMVENDLNKGEYKVFKLTWDGDETSASGDTVSAMELGTLDFGDSLYGLDDVNLVGSEDYHDLLTTGFFDIVAAP